MNMIDFFQSIFFILLIFAAAPVLLINIYAFTAEILSVIDVFINLFHHIRSRRKYGSKK